MINLVDQLRGQFAAALAKLTPKADEYARLVRETQDPKFGDYQANCVMPLRKDLGGNPRQIADQIVAELPDPSIFSSIEVAGPGFINLRLSNDFLAGRLLALLQEDPIKIEASTPPQTMVIDYSSPNVAKPMHVGHLRSTIIGDALARMHRALGWKVFADNHLGDWGTQFGMLIHGWRTLRDESASKADPLKELARLYKVVNKLGEENPIVAEAARAETAKLHESDAENLILWNQFMPWCLADLDKLYQRLDIRFDHQHGESFYHPMLADTVKSLVAEGIAQESEGAICVFFPDPSGKTDEDGKPVMLLPPAIIQKKDGAFTYATSDLACIEYRIEHFKPNVIVYVVDDRQSLHFKQLFETARKWGYDRVALVHVEFGKITDKDGRPYKTREGDVVGLESLLDEAVARARVVVDETGAELPADEQIPEAERQAIAEVVGIGAVKYADLSQNRSSDYVFDWDKMISLTGNTATYLQYVYARTRSIFRKGKVDPAGIAATVATIQLDHPSERALGLSLLRFAESLEQAALDYKPNLLAGYLFELANRYNSFFRDCPVLKAPDDATRNSRLALCELTARVIRTGLNLLGIRTVERM